MLFRSRAANLTQRRLDRFFEVHPGIKVIEVGDEHAEDFGIGFGLEDLAFFFEKCAERGVVFDDPVVDERDAVISVAVRVCVLVVDDAVGCPAGVPDADGALDATDGFEFFFEIHDAPDGFGDLEPVAVDPGDPGGVIASVFESFEPFEKERLGLFISDIGDDATHRRFSSGCLD